MKAPIPSELHPEQVVAICDSREQLPLDLAPLAVEVGTLPTGDYSVKGLVNVVAIERKRCRTCWRASVRTASDSTGKSCGCLLTRAVQSS